MLRQALVETLKLLYAPKDDTENTHLYVFAGAIFHLWSGIYGGEMTFQAYMGFAKDQLQLGNPITCADLGKLGDTIEAHLAAMRYPTSNE